jgi:hypothetical protein
MVDEEEMGEFLKTATGVAIYAFLDLVDIYLPY